MNIDGVEVTVSGYSDMDEPEIRRYIAHIKDEVKADPSQGILKELAISPAKSGNVSLDYVLQTPKFERIRRITGYLVGTIDRWNNAKRAEESERVKHTIPETE